VSSAVAGLLWAFAFVLLEAVQYVFFGGLFQRMSAFQFGFWVFLITSSAFIAWSCWQRPDEVKLVLGNPRLLIAINVTAALAWVSYLGAVQLIEPAIAYTIGAGVMPLTAYLAWRWQVPEGEPMRNRIEATGNVILLFSVFLLAVVTLLGWSGFVRGNVMTALAGVLLAIADGVLFTWLLIFCQRLDRIGVRPATVFGFRFPLYVVVAGVATFGGVEAGGGPGGDPGFRATLLVVIIGIILIVPPLVALQKAVALVSTLTIGTVTALGPFIIFGLQLVEGRVVYSTATMIGIALYSAGAVIAAIGAVRASAHTSAPTRTTVSD